MLFGTMKSLAKLFERDTTLVVVRLHRKFEVSGQKFSVFLSLRLTNSEKFFMTKLFKSLESQTIVLISLYKLNIFCGLW